MNSTNRVDEGVMALVSVWPVTLPDVMTAELLSFDLYDDSTLYAMHDLVMRLYRIMIRYNKVEFNTPLLPRPATTDWLAYVASSIQLTLNTRYGCND